MVKNHDFRGLKKPAVGTREKHLETSFLGPFLDLAGPRVFGGVPGNALKDDTPFLLKKVFLRLILKHFRIFGKSRKKVVLHRYTMTYVILDFFAKN